LMTALKTSPRAPHADGMQSSIKPRNKLGK